jgi:hypothetical protein
LNIVRYYVEECDIDIHTNNDLALKEAYTSNVIPNIEIFEYLLLHGANLNIIPPPHEEGGNVFQMQNK